MDQLLPQNEASKPVAETTPEILSVANVLVPSQNGRLLIGSLLLALVLAAVFLLARKKSQSKGNSLLLVGPSDAGKTAILTTLLYKQTLPTNTSMQTNLAAVSLPETNKPLRVIDVPGHPRIRDQFREYMGDAKAVAFIVDASTISRNGAAVAEHLHQVLHVLTSLPPSQAAPAFAIIAHKSDGLKASASATSEQLAINRVRTVLERELDKRRTSHAGGVGIEGLGAEGEGSELGGLDCTGNGEFRFAEWEGGEVVFLGTHVVVGKKVVLAEDEKTAAQDSLAPLREWLANLS